MKIVLPLYSATPLIPAVNSPNVGDRRQAVVPVPATALNGIISFAIDSLEVRSITCQYCPLQYRFVEPICIDTFIYRNSPFYVPIILCNIFSFISHCTVIIFA